MTDLLCSIAGCDEPAVQGVVFPNDADRGRYRVFIPHWYCTPHLDARQREQGYVKLDGIDVEAMREAVEWLRNYDFGPMTEGKHQIALARLHVHAKQVLAAIDKADTE